MNFEEQAEKLRVKVGILDERPRALGMLRTYGVPAAAVGKMPRFGTGDHLQTCKVCAESGGTEHPKLHAVFAYVRIGNLVHTISWPTWWDELFP